jgi:hypothetical protein
MRILCCLACFAMFAGTSFAADTTCDGISRARKLEGPSRKSFMTQCLRDAKVKCDADADAKKLTGGARLGSVKACLRTAVGG